MARYKLQGTLRDQNGKIVQSGTVTVYLTGTSTLASIYTASAGGTAVNAVTSASDGTFYFYVDDSVYPLSQGYDLVFSKADYDGKTYSDVYIQPQGQIVTLNGTQTLTNKTLTAPTITGATISTSTLTSPVINTGVSGTAIDTTSTLGTSTTLLAPQGTVKHYADRAIKVNAQRALFSVLWG